MTRDLLRKLKQVEMLRRIGGVRRLLNEAYQLLENPIMLFDIDYGLIANAENVRTDDLIWNDITVNGKLSNELREFFREEGFIDAIANAGAITFLPSDALQYERILGKVLNKSKVHVANLLAIASNRAFEGEDPVIFEAICQVFTDEISSNAFYHESGKSHEEAIIKRLIDGNIAEKELYAVHIGILYNGLKDNLFLGVVDTMQRSPEYASLAQFRDVLAKTHPEFRYSIYSNYIVVILSSDDEVLDEKRDLGKLEKLLKQKNAYAGISRRFGNLFELPKYYGEAVVLLAAGYASNRNQRIFFKRGMDDP